MKEQTNFYCAACVCQLGRIILVDLPVIRGLSSKVMALETIDGKPLVLLSCEVAANLLENFLREIINEEEKVLFVFPGNGANYPKRFSMICREVCSARVFAKRRWTPGSDPFVITGQIVTDKFMDLSTRLIVVVDDVISSGQTMRKIYERNNWRFPSARWVGASWVSRKLSMRSSSGIPGYDKIFASFLVPDHNGRKIPINSLSTLVSCPEIAESYAKRNFKNVRGFLDLMQDVFIASLDHRSD